MTFTILVFAEVLPKNIGIAHREALQPHVVYPLWWARRALTPVLYVSSLAVRVFVKVRPASEVPTGRSSCWPKKARKKARFPAASRTSSPTPSRSMTCASARS